jgi:CBS domain-containing protein
MTTTVVSVGPDTPTREVARALSENGISAAPVLDRTGSLIGMISEGDLLGRSDKDREARRDWWLTRLAEGEPLNRDFLASLRPPLLVARDAMASPVVSVGEDAEIADIARLLTTHRIKRVPVVRDGRVVGIVSRADLVRALAATSDAVPDSGHGRGLFAAALAGIDERFLHHQDPAPAELFPHPAGTAETTLSAADFRSLVAQHDQKQIAERQGRLRAAAEQNRRRVAELIDQHITDEGWGSLLHGARHAAEDGAQEFMLLSFPCALCADGGRAINSEQPGWPQTLRGEAAELYLRWERDLKPLGFPLIARVLDFPGGMPGNIGLFLNWGE